MPLLSLQNISLDFGRGLLLDRASLSIEPGDRICLLGRNGAGKSTLMKVLDGTLKPDSGELVLQGGTRVARLDQDVPGDLAGTIYDVVAAGIGPAGALLARYQHVSHGYV